LLLLLLLLLLWMPPPLVLVVAASPVSLPSLLPRADCIVWPPLQLINFTFVAKPYQVLYVNLCNIAWNTVRRRCGGVMARGLTGGQIDLQLPV
jgi:hypothetical protein